MSLKQKNALITGASRGIGRGIAGWITGQVVYADGGASLMTSDVPPEIQFGLMAAEQGRTGT